jgi:transcriptional regulator with XRE-family HTH domain
MHILTLGTKLRTLRKERGWSLSHVAKDSGISVAYLSKLELGQSNPTIDILIKVAATFGMSIDELTQNTHEKQLTQSIPASLTAFLEHYSKDFPELADPDWTTTLANIRFRGRTPDQREDWLTLFLDLKRVLNRP